MACRLFIILLLMLGLKVHAELIQTNCMAVHLAEAIQLNQDRFELYSNLSGGRSIIISKILISFEKIGLWFFAPIIDHQAIPYQRAGLNIICQDFVSMNKAPLFKNHFSQGPPNPKNFLQVDFNKIKFEIKQLIRKRDLFALTNTLQCLLDQLSQEIRYNCLTRHLIESMMRIIENIPDYGEQAKRQGIDDPQNLSWKLLQYHLRGFWIAEMLDYLAYPLQTANIPILCQDVPPIE